LRWPNAAFNKVMNPQTSTAMNWAFILMA
jgi:hypothetical protein